MIHTSEKLCREQEPKGLRFNAAKFVDRVQSVVFCGHLFSSTGLRPNAEEIKTIAKMPPPCDRKAVQQFLGLGNDMARFIPQLANVEKAALLRQVLTQDAQCMWRSSQELALKETSEAIMKNTRESIMIRLN